MKKGIFITGTDTGVGKTLVAALLCAALKKYKQHATYFKPIRTGAAQDSDTQTIADLTRAQSIDCWQSIYTYDEPISPNRVALLHHEKISLQKIKHNFTERLENTENFLVVEGAGGVLVPVNESETMLDLAKVMDLPLLVVARTQLGTINHTLLTLQAAKTAGVPVLGIVLVGEKDPGLKECLEQHAYVPVLAEIPWHKNVDTNLVTKFCDKYFTPEILHQILKDQDTKFMTNDLILEKDAKLLWHPFTQHGLDRPAELVKSAKDAKIILKNGEELIDGISSWWVTLHGHALHELAETAFEQAKKLEQVIFAGFTHEPAVRLAELLIQHVQQKGTQLSRAFFSDNGSTAVEVALKMAFQFHHNQKQTKRTRFLALKHSYHGDTLFAMSVSDPDGYHAVFKDFMAAVDFVEPDDFENLESFIKERGETYAAMIVEPLVQGAGGMRMHSKEFLQRAATLCKQQGILFILDEVFTGFYRTGTCFAFEQAGVKPDILCLSKALTGGFMPLSVTLVTESIYEKFLSQDARTAFLHGHSYTANPIACSVALKSWEILHTQSCQERIQSIVKVTKERITELSQKFNLENPRTLGTIGAFAVKNSGDYFSGNFSCEFSQRLKKQGVYLRPLGSVVYTLPPYRISDLELAKVFDTISQTLNTML